ncbi:hypothetical protein KIPE111705_31070 [Kibdelosporangium persicum]|uniref:TAT (Twin-arginine translocation) pathway-exported protein n=1 Tax=Kibdelosporangium persicum TaxID=2698649 RepID=A0ABX2FFS2_9PSEU|nr:hypothetical protein [Kibdelosporangium persicum]NRN70225.1 TAT (Twin-arginine translocation) pathway-exported protein [Kibdelosporangium persicum]
MSHQFGRRRLLHMSAGVVGLTGLTALPAAADSEHQKFPHVPGMHGDRRANEMWYWFDDMTLYHRIQEVTDAFAAMRDKLGENYVKGVYDTWLEMCTSPGYPRNFAAFVAPVRRPLRVLSQVQLGILDTYYRPGDPRLTAAFSDFGQGVLYDPRRAEFRAEVHMMAGGENAYGYHIWHAFLRAMMFLDIDRVRWARISPLIGFAWALQSTAKPKEREINPPLPGGTVRRMASSWLSRTPRQLDQSFLSWPYPEGSA